MQAQSETQKEIQNLLWDKVEKKKHRKSHVIFQFYWRQKQQQAEAHYIEYTQLHEDNQLEEKHPGVCDEELEERS